MMRHPSIAAGLGLLEANYWGEKGKEGQMFVRLLKRFPISGTGEERGLLDHYTFTTSYSVFILDGRNGGAFI